MTSEAPLGRSYDVQGVDASPGSWPVGMIGLWSYELSRLPANFAVCDGTRGTPDMRGLFPLGVDGTHALSSSGGGTTLAAHTHAFTQPQNHTFTHETAHTITQPIVGDHSSISHSANHQNTAVAAHGNHTISVVEFTALGLAPGASGIWGITTLGAGSVSVSLAHTANHTVTQPDAHSDHTVSAHSLTTNVALSNNAPHAGGGVDAHANGAVGAVSGASATALPPYRALYFVMRLS